MTDNPYRRIDPQLRQRGGLSDEVVAYIRDLILTGALKPGTKIDQEAVSEALDVSRSPIREALVILGKEGLLDVTPRRGAADGGSADVQLAVLGEQGREALVVAKVEQPRVRVHQL